MNVEQKSILVVTGVIAILIGLAYVIERGSSEAPPDVANESVQDGNVLANGGMPTDPTWYWGANKAIAGGDMYINLSPDFLALTGNEYLPMFGFVGFSPYNVG